MQELEVLHFLFWICKLFRPILLYILLNLAKKKSLVKLYSSHRFVHFQVTTMEHVATPNLTTVNSTVACMF